MHYCFEYNTYVCILYWLPEGLHVFLKGSLLLHTHTHTHTHYILSGIELETCSQSFGHHTKALALSFRTYSFRWVPNHHEPEKHLEKIHWCWPGSNPGRLISSLTVYPLCQHAPEYNTLFAHIFLTICSKH